MTRRQVRALTSPPRSLTRFPRWTLTAARDLYRAHTTGRGPWWYASAHGTAGDGRFDLPAPDGTCYFATTEAGAIRERWGRHLVQRESITQAMADSTVVSTLHVPVDLRLADTCSSRAAQYGVTREIGTCTPYSLPQQWAIAFRSLGVSGIRYAPRFSTGQHDLAVAVFGAAGEDTTRVTDPHPEPGAVAAARAGITVQTPPQRVRTIPTP